MPKLKTRKAVAKRYKLPEQVIFYVDMLLKDTYYEKNPISKNENYHRFFVSNRVIQLQSK